MKSALLAVALGLGVASCGWTPADEQVLIRFFEWSRAYDTTQLWPVARVVFDPRTDGVVERFEIVGRSDRRLEGDVVERELTVEAEVRSAAGTVRPRTLRVVAESSGNAWIVTGFR